MRDFKQIIKKKDVFIIAEIGVNYYDIASKERLDLISAAKLMIHEAKIAGADAVKFQSYKAENLASVKAPAYWNMKEEPINSQFELFKKFDKFGKLEFIELYEYCESENIIFISTPFDFEAVDYLYELVPLYKISSSDITNLPLIKYVAKKGKPIFLSTGASTLEEIESAIQTIISMGNNDISILHCILDYPTAFHDVNLNMIKCLKNLYPKHIIGYSDHSKPDMNMMIPTIAYVYGAKIIEKHFTLDKTIVGNDHYHAMDVDDLKKLKDNINFIKRISGQYQKEPIKCEQVSRKQARRSIVADVEISKGETITKDMVTFKRPGTGISPSQLDYVIGGKALKNIKKDDILTYDKVKLVKDK